jgi:uncharacterized protein YkwD
VLSRIALSVATVLSLGVVAPPPPAAAARPLRVGTPQIPVAGVVEPVAGHPEAVPAATLMSQVVTRTNQERHRAGCSQLAVDHDLIAASVNQSYYMARTGRFTHRGGDGSTFVARARAAGYESPSGENIAWGYRTAEEVMAAWMASPGHRANILNCAARSIGTGVVYAVNGLPYYTEVFGRQ